MKILEIKINEKYKNNWYEVDNKNQSFSIKSLDILIENGYSFFLNKKKKWITALPSGTGSFKRKNDEKDYLIWAEFVDILTGEPLSIETCTNLTNYCKVNFAKKKQIIET